jgi:hypothetical protein
VLLYLAWIGTASEQRNSQVQYEIDGQFKTPIKVTRNLEKQRLAYQIIKDWNNLDMQKDNSLV